MTQINVCKDIIRNNGYNLNAYDLLIYIKLLLICEKINNDELLIDHTNFKKSVMIADNRTFKKSLNNLYANGLIKNKFEKLPTKSGLTVTVNKIQTKNSIIINNDVFKYISDLKHIGLQIVCYLKTYVDNLDNDYTNLVEYKTISERLMLNKDTITNHIKLIKLNEEFSYLANKDNFLGDNIAYKEEYIPPKRKSYNTKNLELKLEKFLFKQIELIENGMTVIERQYEVKDGRIDILARDKENKLCIIELKVVPNDEKLIFQCVYYPTQFNEPVRMITIAPDYEYKIKVSLDSLGVERKIYKYENDKLIIQ